MKFRLSESIYTENGFKNRKDYLASLADDYGIDLGTVLNLASVLGPDEDFDALVTELEYLMYDKFNNSDDDYEEDDDKQFTLWSFYDEDLRGVEDSIELDWGDDPDFNDWIWEKCAQGNYVKLKDWVNGEETIYRPVEFNDEDTADLVISSGAPVYNGR